MTLKTWSFSKKKNSTAQPTGQSRDYTVYMKENTSIENPVFILGTGITADISYCQWSGNYYFVDDIVLISADQVELHCSIDVLATHKTAIGNYTGFVVRSSNTHNSYLIDHALSATQDIVHEYVTTTDLFPANADGCYIVRTVCPGYVNRTGIATWVMDSADVNNLLDWLTTDTNFMDVLQDTGVKAFFNPFQYILSIKWFPIAKSDIAGSTEDLIIGWWKPGQFKLMTAAGYYSVVTLNKPTNYYSNDFRMYTSNFSRLIANICSIGVVELDPMILKGEAVARVSIDYVTGEMRVDFGHRITQGGVSVIGDEFASFSGNVGVEIPVGQINSVSQGIPASDWGGGIKGVFEEVASRAVSSAGDFIMGVSNVLSPSKTVIGSTGNRMNLISNPRLYLYLRNYGCGEFPNTVYGRPLCAVRQISTIPGYIKMEAASIALAAPDTEIEKVNSYLNGGFYYE